MLHDESVTRWIDQIKLGDSLAARSLWEHYFTQLVDLAREQLRQAGADRRVSDEEDVALSVLNKFFQSARGGRYPDLSDRQGLWRLLIRMSANKAIDVRRKQSRLRRGGGNVRGDSVAGENGHVPDDMEFAEFMSHEPTPELLAVMSEQLSSLLDRFDDPEFTELVIGKMDGFTNEEMAQRLNVCTRTIERRMRLIREHCRLELDRDRTL